MASSAVSSIGEPCVRPESVDDTFTYIFFDSVLMFTAAVQLFTNGGLPCCVGCCVTPPRLS
ncbi:hypothetical protein EMIT0P260_110093 [Pseudomonas sp. IT-P260]